VSREEENTLTDREITERMDHALRRSFSMPPKAHKEIAGKSGRQSRSKRSLSDIEKGKKKP
jgi:hypothetical protein